MDFQITQQRSDYLASRTKTVLNACPGSGKTTCIVHKVVLLESEWKVIHGKYAGIACLSFTNVAKDEIQAKYKRVTGNLLRYPHLVSTIDSFINCYITLPYYNIINPNFERPKIVEDHKSIASALMVRYTDRHGNPAETILQQFRGYLDINGRALWRTYAPHDIWIEVDGTFTFKGKVPDSSKVNAAIFQQYGGALFAWKLEHGLITSLDSAYVALQILNRCPRIGEWLIRRFPFVIIDEAQDNSAVQHAIFDKLSTLGLAHLELIGDPYQSLYEWRDAKPELFVSKYSQNGWQGLPLSENRRSVQRIINCFSILRVPSDPGIISTGVIDRKIPVTIYRYNSTNPPLIVQDFERKCIAYKFKRNQIVVRGNELKDKMLGKKENIYPWRTLIPTSLLEIKHLFDTQHIKDAIGLLRTLYVQLNNTNLNYHEQKQLERALKTDYSLNARLYAFLFKIPALDLTIENWTTECSVLFSSLCTSVTTEFEFKHRLNGFSMANLKRETMNTYFNKAATTELNIPISTVHQVKGVTLDSILFFLAEDRRGQNISFDDFVKPSVFPTEKQRMIYVACSRPEQFLAIALPIKISHEMLRERFGNDIEIIDL